MAANMGHPKPAARVAAFPHCDIWVQCEKCGRNATFRQRALAPAFRFGRGTRFMDLNFVCRLGENPCEGRGRIVSVENWRP